MKEGESKGVKDEKERKKKNTKESEKKRMTELGRGRERERGNKTYKIMRERVKDTPKQSCSPEWEKEREGGRERENLESSSILWPLDS